MYPEDLYLKNPVLRSLIECTIPIAGPVFDKSLCLLMENIKAKRRVYFFDELAKGRIQLTEDSIKSEVFLHCFFSTIDAVDRTNRKEKIALFGKLLKSSLEYKDIVRSIDDYEEILSILDEMSYREILLLVKLYSYESNHIYDKDINELQNVLGYWDSFISCVSTEFNISKDDINAMLIRLNRTGCYETITGTYLNYKGGVGKLTSLFNRIIKLINE